MKSDPAEDDLVDLVASCLARLDESREPPSRVIEAFCAEHPEHAELLRQRLAHLERAGLAVGRSAPEDGRKLGRFELKGELGRGGMGVVYLAFDPRLGRRVALKALGPRLWVSDRARSRFEREIRAVAGLKHPRIVPIYEVGEDNGIPWYTMELIEGRTLAQVIQALKDLHLRTDELSTSHLNQATFFERGDTDSRLLHDSDSSSLLRLAEPAPPAAGPALPEEWGKTYVETVCRMVHDVAEALDHAHAQGVVHRDVKPSNVLIDAHGRALLFDFGLARMDGDETLTMTGDFAGTPFYVAPEQISGKRHVDHRADVYALGVTLFELLTLQRPFVGRSSQAVFRMILAKDPPLPRRLNRLVPRDLETICLTALEKDPERRYQTAQELAADLRRFLEFRPVRARPVGWPTRVARWSRRNPGAATAAALAGVIALGIPTAVFASGVFLAREAERTARETEKASRINRFLLDVLGSAHPAELGYDGTVREAVDIAAGKIARELLDPDVEAGVRATIGNTYLALGEHGSAEEHLRRALVLRRASAAPNPLEIAASVLDLGRCRLAQGDLAEAGLLLDEALALASENGADGDPLRARALAQQGQLHAEAGAFPAARARLEEALALLLELYGPGAPEHAAGLLELGQALEREALAGAPSAWEEVERAYREALGALVAARGADHPDTAACRHRLGNVLLRKRDLDRAEALFRENLACYAERLGPTHALVARTRTQVALAMHLAGRNAEARAEADHALEVQRVVLPALHADLASTQVVLAQIMLDLDRPEDASPLLEEAVEIRRAVLGSDAPETADALRRLARAYYKQVRLEEAIETGRASLETFQALPSAEEELIAGLRHVLGSSLAGMGRFDEAREHLAAAAEAYARLRGPTSPSAILFRQDLANLLYVDGRFEEAAEAYEQAVQGRRAAGQYDLGTVTALANLAESRARTGRREEALEAAREAQRMQREVGPRAALYAAKCRLVEGHVLLSLGRTEEALAPLEGAVHDLFALRPSGHRDAFDAARRYGRACVELGLYDEAERSLESALFSATAYFGPQHPDVLATSADLRALYELLGRGEDLSALDGRDELSYKLRDAGVEPATGALADAPYAIVPID